MPVFRFNKAFDMVRGAKARLLDRDDNRQAISEQRKKLRSKKRELRRIKQQLRRIRRENHATGELQFADQKRRKRRLQKEIFELERQLHLAGSKEPVTGALPDFLVIGTQKGGTSFLYHLLAQQRTEVGWLKLLAGQLLGRDLHEGPSQAHSPVRSASSY